MIRVKHFLDEVAVDDGLRLWVEPIGLTEDFRKWCAVNYVMPQLGAPDGLCRWFEAHPDGYVFFRCRYHEWLSRSSHLSALKELACESRRVTFTLLHAGDDAYHNCATALREFLNELQVSNAR